MGLAFLKGRAKPNNLVTQTNEVISKAKPKESVVPKELPDTKKRKPRIKTIKLA